MRLSRARGDSRRGWKTLPAGTPESAPHVTSPKRHLESGRRRRAPSTSVNVSGAPNRAAKTEQAIRTPPARDIQTRLANPLCPSRLARADDTRARRRASSACRGALFRSVTRCVTEVRVGARYDGKARRFLELSSATSTNRVRRRLSSRNSLLTVLEVHFSRLRSMLLFVVKSASHPCHVR